MPAPSHRPSLLAVTLAHITVDMHTGSLVVLLPLLLTSFDLGYASAAAIITANNLVIAAAQPLFGTFGDRTSLTWLVPAGCLLTGAAMVSVLFLPSYWLVIPVVMLSGVGSAAFHPEALSRVRAVSGRLAASGTSFFFAGGNVGFALGPTLATLLIGRIGPPGTLLLILPTLLALGFLGSQWRVLRHRQSARVARSASGPTSRVGVAGLVGFLMVLIILRSTTVGGLQTFIPLYFQERGTLPPEGAAFLVTLLLISGVVGTLSGGVLADRFGRKAMMVGSMAVALVGLYLFLHGDGLVRMAALSVSGASISAAWPVIVVTETTGGAL
jgi:FSR family fosmidomycin resistance protein-like MFS transporter